MLLLPYLLLGSALAIGLKDDPIVGSATQSLDGVWEVSIPTLPAPISGYIPGDLLTDMERGGVIGDPLFGNNFDFYDSTGKVQPPFWETGNVSYSTVFEVEGALLGSSSEVLLVLDGVKMASGVWLDGQYLGTTANQFVRWTYPVRSFLATGPSTHTLTIVFVPATDVSNHQARFMACSGGWDWAMYTGLTVGNGNEQSRVFTKGIWKGVSLVAVGPAAMTALKVLTYYTGAYPSTPLVDATAAPFVVAATAYMWVPAPTTGTLLISGLPWAVAGAGTASLHLSLPQGSSSATLNLTTAPGVGLWWGAGMTTGGPTGPPLPHTLHTLTATFTPDAPSSLPLTTSRRFGLRTSHLVTVDDTDPTPYLNSQGSGNFTMRFKLNGADVYARGGNIIPMEELEGRRSAAAVTAMVNASVAAGFNVFRVWGGGIYPEDAFFDACDEAGMMIYQDVMFGSDGRLAPVGNDLEAVELVYQVRRLAHHPSIFQWSACNECGGAGTYASFVSPTIVSEDDSRVIWPSCPSSGWATGVHTLTGLPNGSPLTLRSASSALAARAAIAVAASSSSTFATPQCDADGCTTLPGYDYDTGFVGKVVALGNASECCAACASAGAATCYAASFWQGSCYFKVTPTGALTPSSNGVVSVFPPGVTPPKPTPAACTGAIESHGPYTHGYSASFPAVNGQNDVVNINLPPILPPPSLSDKGPGACGQFTSEFGASVFSSFESMAPTLEPKSWSIWGGEAPSVCTGSPWGRPCVGGNPWAQRNYPGDSFILAFFGPTAANVFNTSGALPLQASLYRQMVAQALEKKGDIEQRRGKNHWGSITWQLNEIWPTGGWGSIEYGTVGFTPGQVLGGRWKPLHHLLESHLYRPVIGVCGADGSCYVRSDDALAPFSGTLTVSTLAFGSSKETQVLSVPLSLPRGGGAFQYECLGGGSPFNVTSCPTPASVLAGVPECASGGGPAACALVVRVVDGGSGSVVDENFQLLAPPFLLSLPMANVSVSVDPSATPRAFDGAFPVVLSTDAFALYVVLTTGAQGRFEENFFPLPGPTASKVVFFIPLPGFDPAELADSIRVDHVAYYSQL